MLYGHTNIINSLSFAPNDSALASGSYNRTIKLWEVKDESLIRSKITGHTDGVSSVGFRPDGTQIASGSYNNTIKIWDFLNSGLTNNQTIPTHDDIFVEVGIWDGYKKTFKFSGYKLQLTTSPTEYP